MQKALGFSLVELMVVVAIIAILATIAFPQYGRYVKTTHRADATADLVSFSQAMERWYISNNSSYLGAATAGANTGSPAIFAAVSPSAGGTVYYNLTISAATAAAYTLTATAVGAQATDDCGTISLTSTGVRGFTDPNGVGVTLNDCW